MLIHRLYSAEGDGGAGTTEESQIEQNAGGTGAGTDEKTASELKRARDEAAAARVKLREFETKEKERADAEAAAEAEKAKNAGEYQKLYEKSQGELKDLKAKAARADALEARIQEMEDSQRTDLLDRLPKNLRKEYEAEGVTLGELQRAVKALGTVTPGKTSSVASGQATDGSKKEGKDMNLEELADLAKSDPAAYLKAIGERASKVRSNPRILF